MINQLFHIKIKIINKKSHKIINIRFATWRKNFKFCIYGHDNMIRPVVRF